MVIVAQTTTWIAQCINRSHFKEGSIKGLSGDGTKICASRHRQRAGGRRFACHSLIAVSRAQMRNFAQAA